MTSRSRHKVHAIRKASIRLSDDRNPINHLGFFYPLFSFSFSFYFYLALWIWLNLNAQSQHDDTEVNDMSVHAQTELNWRCRTHNKMQNIIFKLSWQKREKSARPFSGVRTELTASVTVIVCDWSETNFTQASLTAAADCQVSLRPSPSSWRTASCTRFFFFPSCF